MTKTRTTLNVTLDDAERLALRALLEAIGVEYAGELGVSRPTLYRAIAGFPIRRGSAIALREHLKKRPWK